LLAKRQQVAWLTCVTCHHACKAGITAIPLMMSCAAYTA